MQQHQLLPIPKLSKDNFNLWLDAVRISATANGVHDHIISDPVPPDETDAAANSTFSSKKALAQCIIMASIPSSLLPELGHDIYSKSPYNICLHIKNTFDGSTPIDHALLAESARSITLSDDNNIEDYVEKHMQMRLRMVSSGYPNISDEVTTVMFMIEGLRDNPKYTTIGEQMITNPPTTVRDFSRTLLRLKNFRRMSSTAEQTAPPVFQVPNYKHSQIRFPSRLDYQGPPMWDRYQQRRHPFHPRQQPYQHRQSFPRNVQRPPNYPQNAPWCHFHGTSRHDASQCRQLRGHGERPHAMVSTLAPPNSWYELHGHGHPGHFEYTHPPYALHDYSTPVERPELPPAAQEHFATPTHRPTVTMDANCAAPPAKTQASHVEPTEHNQVVNDNLHYIQEPNRKWYLDSGCYPSHISAPPLSTQPFYAHDYTVTATGKRSPIQYIGPYCLSNKTSQLHIPEMVQAPSFEKNLLSISQICASNDVLFQKNAAYILAPSTTPPPDRIKAVAPLANGLYSLHLNTHPISPTCNTTTVFGRARKPLPSYLRHRSVPEIPAKSQTEGMPATGQSPLRRPPSIRVTTYIDTNTLQPRQQAKSMAPPLLLHPIPPSEIPVGKPSDHETMRWHVTMAHVRPSTLRQMASGNLVHGMPRSLPPLSAPLSCSARFVGKHRKAPHTSRPTPSIEPGSYVASDTCGPVSPAAMGGFQHFLTFLDRASKFCIVKLIKSRSELATIVPATLNEIMTHHNRPIQIFLTDNAKEYTSNALKLYYGKAGIRYCSTVPYTPQENSHAERLNRTLFERARASLHTSGLPNEFWGAAILDAADKYNKTLHKTIMKVPYTVWHGIKPDLSHLLPFGTRGYVPHVTYTKKPKLETRSHPCRYIGMSDASHYLVYNITMRRTMRCRIANFAIYHPERDPTRILRTLPHSLTSAVPRDNTAGTRDVRPRQYRDEKKTHPSTPAPTNLRQAQIYPDADQWKTAYEEEIKKLNKYDSFDPMPFEAIPSGTRILPLTTDFRYKRDAYNNLSRRKVRIALRGDLSEPYVHYDPSAVATYALDKTTARIIFSIAAAQNLSLRHIDIESAFLHERLNPSFPIYVKIPPNFDGSNQYQHPYARLKSNLYGSRQAGHTYYHGMKTFLESHGYKSLSADSCVLVKHELDGNYTIIGVTIDDFLVATTHPSLINEVKQALSDKYTISDMGPPTNYIGWKVTRTHSGIHISQPAAIESVLEEFNMQDSSPAPTPYCDGLLFEKTSDNEAPLDTEKFPYGRGVGLLRYLADCTRPDIFQVTNNLARYLKSPSMRHWRQFKRVLRYLKGTQTLGILYPPNTAPLVSYSDSDFGSCPDTRRSTSGSIHLLNTSPISWNSKRQDTVALSTTEAEYIAACHTAQHTKWLQQLLSELSPQYTRPTTLFIDNQGALKMALANGPTKRSKYVDIKYHYLRDAVSQKSIDLEYIPSAAMLADPFTKILKPQKFLESRSRMNLCPPSSQ